MYLQSVTKLWGVGVVVFSFQGARMVRELFEMARTKKACLIFFDEIDAIGGMFVVDISTLIWELLDFLFVL